MDQHQTQEHVERIKVGRIKIQDLQDLSFYASHSQCLLKKSGFSVGINGKKHVLIILKLLCGMYN